MQRQFPSRDELAAYLRRQFPSAAARDPELSPWQGGYTEATRRLAAIQPEAYAATRDHIDGAVTGLGPYIRHGILSLTAVLRHATSLVPDPRAITKFISELAWRDYWQRLYYSLAEGIWQDREPYKTGLSQQDYSPNLPADIRESRTSLACIDAFSHELRTTGYLHNHARMWLAAYTIHHRRIQWQAGARWFLTHLLDGDPASNNLSWQWVASTFSHKPYFFNRENIEKYTGSRYCTHCPARQSCPFDASYTTLAQRLFSIEVPVK